MYDCIIVGAGHNGLVCACDLAQRGWQVLVLERRPLVGGCCVTEEPWPGFKVSTAAYVVSLLLPEIERDLELRRHGYEVLPRDPSSFTPLEDGRYLLLGRNPALNREEIAKFSTRDAAAYPRYEALLTRIAERLEPILSQTPVDPLPLPHSWRRTSLLDKLKTGKGAFDLRGALRGLGEDLPEAIEMLAGPAKTILDRWFE